MVLVGEALGDFSLGLLVHGLHLVLGEGVFADPMDASEGRLSLHLTVCNEKA